MPMSAFVIGPPLTEGSDDMSDATANDAARLREMISGYMISQIISVSATLGLADQLADRPMSAEALAKTIATHPDALARLLRALSALGLTEQSKAGIFSLARLGALLRSDTANSLRPLALMHDGGGTWQAWGDLLHTLRTGETAFNHVFGMGAFQYGGLHPERAAMFGGYMAGLTQRSVQAILAVLDFSKARDIIDIGGGNGVLLSAILAAFPQAKGVVFDTPAGIPGAAQRLEEACVLHRCDIVTGDFFDAVPHGGDTYILKSVLHDWSDEQSVAILNNCHHAMRPDSTLVVIERLLPEQVLPDDTHREIIMMDVQMLVTTGGRERTKSQYDALFAAAGLTAIAAKPTASPFTVMTAMRSDAGHTKESKP
jgi:orsellinic acid C2-O-methyltransferase